MSSDSVDVALEISVLDKSCDDELLKGRYGAGIEARALVKFLYKSFRQNHMIAADYTVKCIINTQGDADHWYGAKFETALRDLMDMLA